LGFEAYLRTIRYGIKIIFCGHSKPLSVEIMKNGWRPAECQIYKIGKAVQEVKIIKNDDDDDDWAVKPLGKMGSGVGL